ncbi:ApaG domain protein [Oesophagostomum dentatum]|uniref:ApaG domain protein n=1 Tax=Oesophagostomum dentatum TaxID=61180 RepID=A0A0B1TRF1_OESDE|nr:ApaG domain protein [Oesophagostomum dentatum]
MERQQPRTGSKAVRNLVFASRLWMNTDQSKTITELQAKGDDEAVVEQLTTYYRYSGVVLENPVFML